MYRPGRHSSECFGWADIRTHTQLRSPDFAKFSRLQLAKYINPLSLYFPVLFLCISLITKLLLPLSLLFLFVLPEKGSSFVLISPSEAESHAFTRYKNKRATGQYRSTKSQVLLFARSFSGSRQSSCLSLFLTASSLYLEYRCSIGRSSSPTTGPHSTVGRSSPISPPSRALSRTQSTASPESPSFPKAQAAPTPESTLSAK